MEMRKLIGIVDSDSSDDEKEVFNFKRVRRSSSPHSVPAKGGRFISPPRAKANGYNGYSQDRNDKIENGAG